jgi:type III restriction enzyme
MPYAKRRKEPEFKDLNRAYAFVSRTSWPNAVKLLHDRLVDMGFEENEADQFIEKVPDLGLEPGALFLEAPPPTIIELDEDLSSFATSPEEQAAITIEKTEQGSRVILTGTVSAETIDRLTAAVQSDETRKTFEAEARRHSAVWLNHTSPAARNVTFRVPQLCFNFDGDLELAEKDAFLDAAGWRLLDYSTELSEAEFRLTDTRARRRR